MELKELKKYVTSIESLTHEENKRLRGRVQELEEQLSIIVHDRNRFIEERDVALE